MGNFLFTLLYFVVLLAIVFGIGIAILVIAYCVFYIGDGYIINFEKLFSKLSKETQYILLGVYVLFLLITAILSFVL